MKVVVLVKVKETLNFGMCALEWIERSDWKSREGKGKILGIRMYMPYLPSRSQLWRGFKVSKQVSAGRYTEKNGIIMMGSCTRSYVCICYTNTLVCINTQFCCRTKISSTYVLRTEQT